MFSGAYHNTVIPTITCVFCCVSLYRDTNYNSLRLYALSTILIPENDTDAELFICSNHKWLFFHFLKLFLGCSLFILSKWFPLNHLASDITCALAAWVPSIAREEIYFCKTFFELLVCMHYSQYLCMPWYPRYTTILSGIQEHDIYVGMQWYAGWIIFVLSFYDKEYLCLVSMIHNIYVGIHCKQYFMSGIHDTHCYRLVSLTLIVFVCYPWSTIYMSGSRLWFYVLWVSSCIKFSHMVIPRQVGTSWSPLHYLRYRWNCTSRFKYLPNYFL